jgi:hypothetical protein
MQWTGWKWVLLISISSSACGGGGGGGGEAQASPSVTSTNARAAWRSLISTPRVMTTSGRGSDDANYQLSITIQPVGTTTVNGTEVQLVTFSSILNRNSVANNSSSFDLYLVNGTGVAFAYREPSGDCSLFASASEPPISPSLVGQSGALYSGTVVVGCSTINGVPIVTRGTVSGTWSVQSEGATTFLCVESKLQDFLTTSQVSCLELTDTAGTLGTRVRVTLTQTDTAPLVLRNY